MEIKRCIHCGGKARVIYACGDFWVQCYKDCLDTYSSSKKAIEAWNKRVIPQGYVELKKVEEILENHRTKYDFFYQRLSQLELEEIRALSKE